jgi:hypothetical protein
VTQAPLLRPSPLTFRGGPLHFYCVAMSTNPLHAMWSAAERAQSRGLRNIVTRELDMEHLDVGDASFDKVLCREALMLAGPVAGLLASLPDDMTSTIRTNAEATLRPFATESGYVIPGRSLVGVGRHPGVPHART